MKLIRLLNPLKKLIQRSFKKTNLISIDTTHTENLPWQSQFGGMPYLGLDMQYPKGSSGQLLPLLAQINFAEIFPLYNFPREGILQIFTNFDPHLGLNTKKPLQQDNWRIVWIPKVIEHQQFLHPSLPNFRKILNQQVDRSQAPFLNNFLTPKRLKFKLFAEDLPCFEDDMFLDFQNLLNNKISFKNQIRGVTEYCKLTQTKNHKIGGYPHFWDADNRPREFGKASLLLQIKTDIKNKIFLEDENMLNFFIKPKDLQKRDFSNVLFLSP